MSTPPNIKLKADVGRLIDGEAWKAMEDGRASLEGSLWHLRQGWALEKAEKIIDLVMSDTGSRRTLEHWRQEVGKLHSQIAAKDSELAKLREDNERLRDALNQIAEMANWQIGVPTDTEAANEHARIAHTMAETARAVAFTGGPDAN